MSILKLPDVGNTATMTITACEVVAGQFGQQVKFSDAKGNDLYLPKKSADGQLLRISFDSGENDEDGQPAVDYAAVVGEVLVFSRTPNSKPGSKPYWDIALGNKGDVQASVAPSKRLTQAAAQKPAPEEDDGYGPMDETPKSAPLLDRITALTGEPTDKHANERSRLTAAYMQLWRDVATEQTAVSKNLDLPVDGTSVQAATATILITFSQKGVQ